MDGNGRKARFQSRAVHRNRSKAEFGDGIVDQNGGKARPEGRTVPSERRRARPESGAWFGTLRSHGPALRVGSPNRQGGTHPGGSQCRTCRSFGKNGTCELGPNVLGRRTQALQHLVIGPDNSPRVPMQVNLHMGTPGTSLRDDRASIRDPSGFPKSSTSRCGRSSTPPHVVFWPDNFLLALGAFAR